MFFSNPQKRFVKQAKELLVMAEKVLDYRKDVLNADAISSITKASSQLTQVCMREKYNAQESTKLFESLKQILKKHGGKIYPITFFSDNVEMLLVTLILAIGLRTYFIQPFKIPTNSMWPTFHGMIAKVYTKEASRPNRVEALWNTIVLGAMHYEMDAPANGKVMIPIFQHGDKGMRMGLFKFKLVEGRKWFGLLPDMQREYTFYVDNKPVSVRVPLEFNLDSVIQERFLSVKPVYSEYGVEIAEGALTPRLTMSPNGPVLITAESVERGKSILDFDILSGDMLFVDRFTYHFRQPKIGEPIVFKTRNIPGLAAPDGTPDDRYYIKRLVGTPGDVLQIVEPVLMRNGAPITGSLIFEKNAKREGVYPGYVYAHMLDKDLTVTIPKNSFFGMGDNSPGSKDSRSFGFVPEKEVIGRALFIFYPFTNRWGLTD